MPVVIIKMAEGRSSEQKKQIVHDITGVLVKRLEVPPEIVTIFVEEFPKENIGKSGILLSETGK